jgi:hypothetical protein
MTEKLKRSLEHKEMRGNVIRLALKYGRSIVSNEGDHGFLGAIYFDDLMSITNAIRRNHKG